IGGGGIVGAFAWSAPMITISPTVPGFAPLAFHLFKQGLLFRSEHSCYLSISVDQALPKTALAVRVDRLHLPGTFFNDGIDSAGLIGGKIETGMETASK